jgi:pilus assembly protein CpaE
VYQLDVILIGCDEEVVPHLRRELMGNVATIEAEFRDAGEALEVLRTTKTKKRLLILQLNPVEGLEELDRLCQFLLGWPVMVVMDAGEEDRARLNSAFENAMRMGAAQTVGLPLHSGDFKTALDRLSVQFVSSAKDDPKVIAVAGVTGGCGATTLAINLGQEIAHLWNKRCILVDLSLKMGVIASHLNLEPHHSIHDLLSDVRRVDEALVRSVLFKITEGYELLAGPDRLVATHGFSAVDVIGLLELMKPMCDVILIDLPCTYDDFYFEILAGAAQIVLVGEQIVPSIRALKLVREMVGRDESCGTECVVINRFDKNARNFSTQLLMRILGVPTLHTIMQDAPAFGKAMDLGCTLRMGAPRSLVLAEIDSLARQLMGGDAATKEHLQRSWLVGRMADTVV